MPSADRITPPGNKPLRRILAKVGNDITGGKQKRDGANFLIFVVFPFPFKLFAFFCLRRSACEQFDTAVSAGYDARSC